MYPLHQAIQTGQLEVVKRLLSEPDIDPNTKNTEGVLHYISLLLGRI
jgi:ankyrin repeat protein